MQTWNTMAITRILFLQVGQDGTSSGSGQRQANRDWGPGGNQGTGSEEGRCHQQQGDVPNTFNTSMAHTSATVDAGPVSIPP